MPVPGPDPELVELVELEFPLEASRELLETELCPPEQLARKKDDVERTKIDKTLDTVNRFDSPKH